MNTGGAGKGSQTRSPIPEKQVFDEEEKPSKGVLGRIFGWFVGGDDVETTARVKEAKVGETRTPFTERELEQGEAPGSAKPAFDAPGVELGRMVLHETEFAAGYRNEVYEKHKEAWDVILNEMSSWYKNFDAQEFRENPMLFFGVVTSNEMVRRKFSEHIFYNGGFSEAWGEIQDAQIDYMDALLRQYYQEDKGYAEIEREHAELAAEWNGMIEENGLVQKEEFEGYEEMEALAGKLYAKESAFCKALMFRFYEDSPEFQEALTVLQEIKGKHIRAEDEPKVVFEKLYILYRENKTFAAAYDKVHEADMIFRNMMAFNYDEKDLAIHKAITGPRLDSWEHIKGEASAFVGVARDMSGEIAFDAAKFAKEHPAYFVTPATALGTFLFGPMVPVYAVGAAFASNIGRRVVGSIYSYMKQEGVFADMEAAKQDRATRAPHLMKIFSKPTTMEMKIKALNDLVEDGLLFYEDLSQHLDEDVKLAFLKQLPTETQLPEYSNIVAAREKQLPVLKAVFIEDPKRQISAKFDALEALYVQGCLFYEDVEQYADGAVKERLNKYLMGEGTSVADLPRIGEIKNRRNSMLFIVKGGAILSQEQKLAELMSMKEKGVLFQQDIERVEKEDEALARVFLEGVKKSELPDLLTHYVVQEHTLRRQHEVLRAGIMARYEGDPVRILSHFHSNGLLFKEDLVGVDQKVMAGLRQKNINVDRLYSKNDYYKTGRLGRLKKVGSLMVKVIRDGKNEVYNSPANIVYGPLKGLKSAVVVSLEALNETFHMFTDTKSKSLQDRVIKQLPGNVKLKQAATFAFNKGVGTLKWATLGASIGGMVTGWFGLPAIGMTAGGAIGGFFGMCATNGRVSQIPKGGFIRAFKFSGKGALVGAVVPATLGIVVTGLAIAGVVGISAVSAVATMGLSLIIPCILFGAWAGYMIAGLTGKDEDREYNDEGLNAFKYAVPVSAETGGLLLDVELEGDALDVIAAPEDTGAKQEEGVEVKAKDVGLNRNT